MSVDIHSASTGFAASSSGVPVNISSFAMVAAVIFLSLLLIFLFFVYLYTDFYGGSWYTDSTYWRAQFLSDSGAATRGLDPAVLSSLPISICRPIDLELALECSVCLSELSSSEAARFLPKCSHGFHLECIDKWFRSHSTCPLCRCPVGAESSSPAKVPPPVGASQREDSGSSISIPIRSTEGCLPSPVLTLPSSTSQSEELKSPEEGVGSPAASKLRTLRNLLSMGKKTGGSACSGSRVCDVEQGNTASPEEK